MRRMIKNSDINYVEDLKNIIDVTATQGKIEIKNHSRTGDFIFEITKDSEVNINNDLTLNTKTYNIYTPEDGEIDLNVRNNGGIVIKNNALTITHMQRTYIGGNISTTIGGNYSSEADDYVNFISFNEDGATFYSWSNDEQDFIQPLIINNGLIVLNLPTSDPEVENALWNDNGTLKISSGS